MKIKELFIKVKMEHKRNDGTTFDMDYILNSYYKVPKSHQDLAPITLFKAYSFINREKVEEFIKQEGSRYGADAKLKDFSLTFIAKKSRYIKGEYFAHEYDTYAPAKARRLEWYHGEKEFEVKCLDNSLSVMDGIWDDELVGVGRISNGCGDHFEPFERGLV